MLSASDFIHMLQVWGAGQGALRLRLGGAVIGLINGLPLIWLFTYLTTLTYVCTSVWPAVLPQRLRSVVSSSANPMSEQEMDLHTIR